MVWVPPGRLLAGTAPSAIPRVADAELAGVAIELGGFLIDVFSYPGEPAGIAQTGVSFSEARAICRREGKRLCTELEWERACKGPDNRTYEYGDRYDEQACGTGSVGGIPPNGANRRCLSGFGARDMHGGVWNWTASHWGRGGADDLLAVRGGDGQEGELVGRCANGRPLRPNAHPADMGVRCCAGRASAAFVDLKVERGPLLVFDKPSAAAASSLLALLPASVRAAAARPPSAPFVVERSWWWRPLGNERLRIGAGCAQRPVHDLCGVVIARPGGARPLAYVSTDWWIGEVAAYSEPRKLVVRGGDIGGAYRRIVEFRWGRVVVGDKERKRGGGWSVRPSPP